MIASVSFIGEVMLKKLLFKANVFLEGGLAYLQLNQLQVLTFTLLKAHFVVIWEEAIFVL